MVIVHIVNVLNAIGVVCFKIVSFMLCEFSLNFNKKNEVLTCYKMEEPAK